MWLVYCLYLSDWCAETFLAHFFCKLDRLKSDFFCLAVLKDGPDFPRLGMSISNTNKHPTKANLRQVTVHAQGMVCRRIFTMVEMRIEDFQDLLSKGQASLVVGGGGASALGILALSARIFRFCSSKQVSVCQVCVGTMLQQGFVMHNWNPSKFPSVLTDSYVSVEVANAAGASSKA